MQTSGFECYKYQDIEILIRCSLFCAKLSKTILMTAVALRFLRYFAQ